MTTDIQIRGVPEETKKELKRRAAQDGLSVSSYVLRLIMRHLVLPSRADFAASMANREPFELGRPAAEILEEVRRGEDLEPLELGESAAEALEAIRRGEDS